MSDNFDDVNDISDDGFENVCSMCRRPESKAGRLIKLAENMNFLQESIYFYNRSINHSSL